MLQGRAQQHQVTFFGWQMSVQSGSVPFTLTSLQAQELEMPMDANRSHLLPFISDVVVAQVSSKKVTSSEIAPLIQSICEVFQELSVAGTPASKPVPAVPIKSSVTPDYIVCLEDGIPRKML